MQIHGTERERRELHAVLMEVYRAGMFGTEHLLFAEERLRNGDRDGARNALVTAAGCEAKILELVKRLVVAFKMETVGDDDLYLAPDEMPGKGQPCSLQNLRERSH